MTNSAMASYMSLCGNELFNGARTKAYIDNGIFPKGFTFHCQGCEGLIDLLPCIDSRPPSATGCYDLPETDGAPWYDPAVPESKNFAGLMVTEVTMSAPYSRTVTDNIGNGQTLGRLKLKGRTIVVRGWLVGKTCCATQYGLRWLTSALGEPSCGDSCGGCELDFLDCCPNISGEDDCLTTIVNDQGQADDCTYDVYVRQPDSTEFQRGQDFFRRMNGVGITDGPTVLQCKGRSCGCGCGGILEIEFTLNTESPYINHLGIPVLEKTAAPVCPTDDDCDIIWSTDCGDDGPCPGVPDCLVDDPYCVQPVLPPSPAIVGLSCACTSTQSKTIFRAAKSSREWGSSTLNFEVYAGSKPLRNLAIRVYQNPLNLACSEDTFDNCDACSTFLISYVPAGGVLRFSGEEREVTIECNNQTRNALGSVAGADGLPFDWPDLTCSNMCYSLEFDCFNTAADATFSVERVDRDL